MHFRTHLEVVGTHKKVLAFLESRILSSCQPGATALAQGLRGNSVLEQLNLTGNLIGDAGVISLLGSLVGPSRGFLNYLLLNRCEVEQVQGRIPRVSQRYFLHHESVAWSLPSQICTRAH